jgi:hypothetical protein
MTHSFLLGPHSCTYFRGLPFPGFTTSQNSSQDRQLLGSAERVGQLVQLAVI